ncbi:uncharacterized protein LOC113471583 [Diaphorina citri]|uniref:Uncharacterized protein LOC113471583 n=1 Tax=Diaphorina citri TaxID=121845 RepID=A0A3Q0JIQ0_DIACI|nr:uncharacterized protein LOC113471583 [Diaphorina citri]
MSNARSDRPTDLGLKLFPPHTFRRYDRPRSVSSRSVRRSERDWRAQVLSKCHLTIKLETQVWRLFGRSPQAFSEKVYFSLFTYFASSHFADSIASSIGRLRSTTQSSPQNTSLSRVEATSPHFASTPLDRATMNSSVETTESTDVTSSNTPLSESTTVVTSSEKTVSCFVLGK